MRCAAYRCREEALSDGQLCQRHQRRLDSGGGLPIAGEPVVGDVSGYGRYGIVDIDDLGMLCHECGERFVSVGAHTASVHGLPAKEYRQKHGIEGSLTLPAGDSPRRRQHPCGRCGVTITTPLRLCDDCRRRRAQPKPKARPRWRSITGEEVEALRAVEGARLEELVRSLQADRVPSKQIGAVLGLSGQQMAMHFPRPEWPRSRGT